MPPSRNILTNTLVGNEYSTFTGSDVATPRYVDTRRESKTFWYGKEGNYGYPDFPPDKNVGHAMRLTGYEWYRSLVPVGEIWRGGANNQRYVGALAADVTTIGDLAGTFPPDAWGATAYSKMKPTKPNFEILNSTYELRELPNLLRQRFLKDGLSSVGNYYLAMKFGWESLLRDVINLVNTQMSAQDRLEQLLRDNGRPVRRKILLQDETTAPVVGTGDSYSALQPVLVTQYYRKQPNYRSTRYYRDKVWGSAQYRYWLPSGPRGIVWTAMMKARIFGLRPTPSVIYNAIPWTWLHDWFYNLGDIIDNLDAGVANRLAADYFYMMRSYEYHYEITCNGYFKARDGRNIDVTGTSASYSYQKYRAKGDPFGFNTNQNTLTGMQWSILGALGMSRLL
jgi:hypothetical protein